LGTLKNKNKVALAAMAAVAILLVIAVPFASAQTVSSGATVNVATMKAEGVAYQEVNGQTLKYQANFTLMLQPASTSSSAIKCFDVAGGTVVVNGASYAIESGNGAVRTGRHIFMLQAQGTSPDGQTVTLKLEGRYFWLGGHLYVARIGAKLQTDNGNYLLLMRAAVKV